MNEYAPAPRGLGVLTLMVIIMSLALSVFDKVLEGDIRLFNFSVQGDKHPGATNPNIGVLPSYGGAPVLF